MRELPSPLTPEDVAVRGDDGRARYEWYDDKGGYAVSPYHPFVRQRADDSVSQVTAGLPCDLLFQDQIGARPWTFDSNPASPSPLAFIDGWIDHTKRHAAILLGTEQGFDALIPTEVAFFGSVPGEDNEWSDTRFGPGNWQPWPFVPIVAGDKVLLYPHNMGANPADDATFRLNVSFGKMMMYKLHDPEKSIFSFGPRGGLDSDVFRTVSALQQQVISRYVTQPIEEFEWLAPRVTRARFRSVEVVANGDDSAPFAHAGFKILPGGFLVLSDDGRLTAGVLDRWNGLPLSPGRHLVIEKRGDHGVEVWKPSGGSTSIVIRPLASWGEGTPVEVRALDVRGDLVRTVPATETTYGILFRYETSIDQRLVDHYEIVNPTRVPRRRGVRP